MRGLWRLACAAAMLGAVASLPACGHRATQPLAAGEGPNPVLPAPRPALIPTLNIAPATGWAAGGKPAPAAGLRGERLGARAGSSALDRRAPEQRHPGRRNQRPGAARGCLGPARLGAAPGATPRRGRRAERQPHHPAARGRAGRGRAARIPDRTELAPRHGAGRQQPVRRRHRRPATLPLSARTDGDHGRPAPRSATCLPARSTITGPRTWSQARTAPRST